MQEHQYIELPDPASSGIGQAIILAGGLGTRLRSVVSELPKCMAPVNGKPFLHYVIKHLQNQGVTKFIFSVGYKYEAIVEYLETLPGLQYQLAIEEEPLGTGGAIRLACTKATEANVLALNGDTMFSINVNELLSFHLAKGADCTLSLKPMQDFDRYGVVELDTDSRVQSFREKQFYKEGLINGGVYAINAKNFLTTPFPEKFSFEKDYLEKDIQSKQMFGVIQNKYFIDIGIPEDYERAQHELKAML